MQLSATLFALSGLLLTYGLPGQIDVEHYDLDVDVQDEKIFVTATVRARLPQRQRQLSLALADTMTVRSAQALGEEVPYRTEAGRIELDLSSLPRSDSRSLEVTITADGKPHTQFSQNRGGFLRTCVSEDITYIRGQYDWYPRARNDPATARVTVDVKEGWRACTAGDCAAPKTAAGRTTWVFERKAPAARLGLVAGPYHLVSLEAGSGFVLDALVFDRHRDGAKALLEVARRSFEFYRSKFGDVRASRFSLVEMPAAFGRGSGYGEADYVLIGEGAFSGSGAAPWARALVAHEVSHTWWGQEVMFAHFASESLASYATLAFLDADQGPAAARAERRAAVDRVVDAAAAGKEVALGDIENWGSGMDPQTYRAHAYEKGMMLLWMIERAAGREALDATLAGLFRRQRGNTIDWEVLREALAGCGREGRAIVAQWAKPGIPELQIDWRAVKSSGRSVVRGTLTQRGTPRPIRMQVPVVALCGATQTEVVVELTGAKKTFEIATPATPDAVRVDPEYHLLVARPATGIDPKVAVERVMGVVNSPGEADPTRLRATIAALVEVLQGDPGKYEGLCYTGIGRCRFRLGEFEAARAAFADALRLGAGGPFHRSWIYLRLGNMADVENDRQAALQHYDDATAQGTRYVAAKRAGTYRDRPYRGYDKER